MRVTRWVEIIVGGVFATAAALKAADLPLAVAQAAYYGVLSDPVYLRLVALALLALETALGAVLLAGVRLRGWTLSITFAVLTGFTILIVYAWFYHDLGDCGCFGGYLAMGPGASIAKNLVLMALIGVAWRWEHRVPAEQGGQAPARAGRVRRAALGVLACGVVVLAVAFGDNAHFFSALSYDPTSDFSRMRLAFEGERWELAQGTYVLVVLTATCEHCQATVESLNEVVVAPDTPPVIGLLFGENEEELTEFRNVTQPLFPTPTIEADIFFDLIGEEPPRFYFIEDGKALRHLDDLEPTVDVLLAFIEGRELQTAAKTAPAVDE